MAELEVETRTVLVLELAELFPPQGQWTEEAYFALSETNRYVERSEGELMMLPHCGQMGPGGTGPLRSVSWL